MKKTIAYFLSFILALLFCYGCENQSTNRLVQLNFDEKISIVKSGKAFTLTLPQDHPDKLAIVSPDETWFYIQGDENIKNLMPKDDFMKSNAITINTGSLKGTSWKDGEKSFSHVFTKKGTYTVYLSDNLETEIDNSLTFIKKLTLN